MNFDTYCEQSTRSQEESEDKCPEMNKRSNMGSLDNSEMQQLASLSNYPMYVRSFDNYRTQEANTRTSVMFVIACGFYEI